MEPSKVLVWLSLGLLLVAVSTRAHASRYWLSRVIGSGIPGANDPQRPALASHVTHYQMAVTFRGWTVVKTDDESYTTSDASNVLLPQAALNSVVSTSLAVRNNITTSGTALGILMPTMTSTTTLRSLLEGIMTPIDPRFTVADWFAGPKVGNTIYLNDQFATDGPLDIAKNWEQIGPGGMDISGGQVISREGGQNGYHRNTVTPTTDDYFVSATAVAPSGLGVTARHQLSSAGTPAAQFWGAFHNGTSRILLLQSTANFNVIASVGSYTINDRITIEVNGNTRAFYWNGGQMGSSSANSVFPTGTTGFWTSAGVASGTGVLDSFCVSTTLAEARDVACAAAAAAAVVRPGPPGGPSAKSLLGVGN